MAVPVAHDDGPSSAGADADADFVRDASLTYVVPEATDSHLEQALEACIRAGQSPQAFVDAIVSRESLFFDETVDVYLILRVPYDTEARLRGHIDRLSVVLDAHVLNSNGSGREAPPATMESIFNGTIDDLATPLAIVSDPTTSADEESSESSESGESSEDDSDDGSDNGDDSSGAGAEVEGGGRRKTTTKTTKTTKTRQTFILWKQPVFLARPRTRLHNPSVTFAAAASLKPASPAVPNASAADGDDDDGAVAAAAALYASAAGSPSGGLGDGFLRSREPAGLNLLASFGGDPALAGTLPRLSAQRVSHVAPAAAAAAAAAGAVDSRLQPTRLLPGLKAVTLAIAPAVHARVRFARPNSMPTSPAVVAILEVDFTPSFDCEAVLSRIDLALPSGVVTDLNSADGLGLPLYCVARDHFAFLYRLAPLPYDVVRTQPQLPPSAVLPSGRMPNGHVPARELSIAIDIRMLVKPGVCTPTLRMSWATAIDFTLPVNPGFGTALLPQASLQRAHRPSQLSIDGMSSFTAPSISRPDALPSLESAAARSTETTIPDFGITMTLTAPAHTVYAGEEFAWTVFVVNRASPTSPAAALASPTTTGPAGHGAHGSFGAVPALQLPPARKLALIVLPKRRRNDVRVLRPPSTAGGRHHGNRLGGMPGSEPADEAVADAVLDENIVHAMQRSSLVDSTEVVCLSSADTRVGPLAPNACHVVELRFVALRAGAVGVEAIRVVDLGSQEHVDLRELPAMFIAEGQRPVEAMPA